MKLYHRTAKGQVKVWHIRRENNLVYRTWGIQGGRMQETVEQCRSMKGKSTAQVAIEFYNREVKKKTREGYTPEFSKVRADIRSRDREITFTTLPPHFAPQKPVQSISLAKAQRGDFMYQRKRDGQRHFAMTTPQNHVRLFSRKLHDMTRHMPEIVRAIEAMDLPPRTLIDGEIICDRNGVDDFRATNEVCRANPDVARKAELRLPIRYMMFDLIYFDGVNIYPEPYLWRFEQLEDMIVDDERLLMPESYSDFKQAHAHMAAEKWEGLVLWERKAPGILRMDGKPARCGSFKWKPIVTGDFIATGWEPGNGRNSDRVGKLNIAEWQGKKLVNICNVGGGFTDEERRKAMRWTYPCVVELEYALQQPDTRALREPVFIRKHPDKTVEELR